MPFTARELRQRARDELRDLTRRREALAVEAVRRYAAVVQAREAAREAELAATEVMAAAVITFGRPEKAAAVTGLPVKDFRVARRAVSADRAVEVAAAVGERVTNRAESRPRRVPARSDADSTDGSQGSAPEGGRSSRDLYRDSTPVTTGAGHPQ
jgi:hypothetical protein